MSATFINTNQNMYFLQLVRKYKMNDKKTPTFSTLTPNRVSASPSPIHFDLPIKVPPKPRIKRKLSPINFTKTNINRLEDLDKYRAKYKKLMAESFMY